LCKLDNALTMFRSKTKNKHNWRKYFLDFQTHQAVPDDKPHIHRHVMDRMFLRFVIGFLSKKN
jgi:hypothetical protein